MKNLFLTLALMCCVSFAFANEGEGSENENRLKHDVQQQKLSLVSQHCFALTCTTWCQEMANPSDNALITVWEMMDAKLCTEHN